MHEFTLGDFHVGPYVHLAVSAFTGRVGYIHRKFLPPFLRVDELRQPPHEPVAQAADVRGIRHGLAHPPFLLGHRVTRALRREAPAQRGATTAPGPAGPPPAAQLPPSIPGCERPLHPAAGPVPPGVPSRLTIAAGPRCPGPRFPPGGTAASPPPLELPL